MAGDLGTSQRRQALAAAARDQCRRAWRRSRCRSNPVRLIMISDDALDALKARNPVPAVAGQWVKLRKGSSKYKRHGFTGPCPICSRSLQSASAGRFECNDDEWICAVCHDKGDVIKLVQKREGIGFRDAIERLGGAREEKPTPALAHRAGLRAHGAGEPLGDVPPPYGADPDLRHAWVKGWTTGAERDRVAAQMRERELGYLRAFWKAGERWPGTPVEDYLACRGVVLPANARLKYHPAMPLFADGRTREPLLVHRGPAMLAAFRAGDDKGTFRGLHITWIDTAAEKCKAIVRHPHTGEVLPSKKMRGSKSGCYLDLGGAPDPRRIIAGEGIETVAAVYTAYMRCGLDMSATALRAAGDLGNLAGRSLQPIAHPYAKTENGRAQRVPGPEPDLASPAMPVPDSVVELVLLGDGDSDPFLTRNALERASYRHARPGRLIRRRFAPDGLDFNDVMQGKD
ncbi:CHC2 zinc finger domain-containing protein [Bradyrhizobium sp. SZCCHNR1093]|uniref:DUF7146 domain-containing protein n=1 Tax=Bradyrhizobium sp. SZCCHNR1093 TaxID=3057368 RepID=UPI0028E31A35|nr:CHC2 zinc finger domain-containing protein [Bradyrhizobium sp. SZCCHNR1093]